MTTTKDKPQAPDPKASEPTTEEKPARQTVSAPTLFDKAMATITEAGEGGISVKALAEALGVSYRVAHNVGWRLEGSPAVRDNPKKGHKVGDITKPDEVKAQRVNKGRTVLYATLKG